MAFKKFNPKHADHLDNAERKKNVDFEKLFSEIGITHGNIIADIGAGTGFYSIPLSKAVGPHGKIYAVDMLQEMLDRINIKIIDEKIENIVLVLSMENKIKIDNSSIDMVFTSSVFHEMRGTGTLNEIQRILKPGGKFIVIDWKKKSKGGPPSFIKKKPSQVIMKCKKSGFEFVREFDTSSKNKYGLIFNR